MTYTYKLARRLARMRRGPSLLLPFLAACAAGEPTGIAPIDTPENQPAATPPVDGPVAVSPRKVTLERSQHIVFKAFASLTPGSSQVTSIEWTATGGTIASDGSYTPSSSGTFRVIGKRKGNPKNPADTATVDVVPPQPTVVTIALTPSTVSLNAGQSQQFSVTATLSDGSTAQVGLTYSATGGIISAAGSYTAGATAGTFSVIATAPDGHADTASVTIASAPPPPATPFSSVTAARNSGTSATVSWVTSLLGVTQFELQKAAKATTLSWSTYNYPVGTATSQLVSLALATSSYCFRLRATKPTVSDWSQMVCADPTAAPAPTLSSITMTPATVSLSTGGSQQFGVSGKMSDGSTASVTPTYSATGGTISAAGLYTAGSTGGSFRVIATAQGNADTSTITITVASPTLSSIVLSPASVSLSTGGSQQFGASGKMSDGSTASVTPTYRATGGIISAAGLYTAGTTAGSFRVIATAQGKADTSAVTIAAPSTGGSLWWSADFESGAWPSGTTFEQCGQRIKVYSNGSKPAGAPAAGRRGSFFVGYTVLDSDVSPCTPTSNPRASGYKEKIFHPGDEVWEQFSVYIPNGFPSVPHFMMFQEDYGAPFNSPPPNGIWLQNFDGTGNKFYITGNYDAATKTNVRVWSAKIVTGVWHDFMVHKRFATDKSGWLEIWFDGQQVTFSNGSTRLANQQTMLSGATSANFSMMHYRSANMFPVSQYPNGLTIYFDELRVGTSRSSVELTSSLLASMP